MTLIFCSTSYLSLVKEEEETIFEIIRSFVAALAAELAAGLLAYFLADKLNADKLIGKKEDKFKL